MYGDEKKIALAEIEAAKVLALAKKAEDARFISVFDKLTNTVERLDSVVTRLDERSKNFVDKASCVKNHGDTMFLFTNKLTESTKETEQEIKLRDKDIQNLKAFQNKLIGVTAVITFVFGCVGVVVGVLVG